MKSAASTAEKNKRAQTSCRRRHNGQLAGHRGSCCKHSRHEIRHSCSAEGLQKVYPSIQAFCADAGYRGTFVDEVNQQLRRRVDISEKIKPHEWEKLPWRWIVERTFAWMNAARRLAKEFEISVSIEESMIIIACAAVLLRRL